MQTFPPLPGEEIAAVMAGLGVSGPYGVEQVAYEPGSPATAALARVRGNGWSVFVKQIQSVRHWPRLHLVPEAFRANFAEQFPWRQELAIWDERFAGRLPKNMRVPVLYRLTDLGDDRLLIWMEDVDAIGDAEWTLDHFARAATALGALTARRMDAETLAATGVPTGYGLREYTGSRVRRLAIPQLDNDAAWAHPHLADGASVRSALRKLSGRCEAVLQRLDELPQAVPHGDASPQNLLVPRSAPDEFVAIDLSFQSPQAVGFDLGQLLIGLVHAGHLDTARLPEIHERILVSFIEGLAAEGFVADPDRVHYGYVGSLLLRAGFTAIPYEVLGAPGTAELFRQRLRLTEFIAELALEII